MPTLHYQRAPQVIQRGVEPYALSFNAMREFTNMRTGDTPDQFWIVEHYPVYTLGLGADPQHILIQHEIPVIQTDRGGEVTYHGLGQAVIYLLLDLRRFRSVARLFVRELVKRIEQGLIETLEEYNLVGERRIGAPGIYIADGEWQGAKIASLGLKVNASGLAYHGVSLNVNMDLKPFSWINPCGQRGLRAIDMKTLGVNATLFEVQLMLANKLVGKFNYAI
jgi:lipoyl(octanoyl) transferase